MNIKNRKLIGSKENKISIIQIIGFALIFIGIIYLLYKMFCPLKYELTGNNIAIVFFIIMLGISFAFPSLLEGNDGLSTMRIVVFMMTNVICMLLLKIGWKVSTFEEIGIDANWVGIIAFVFGAKATQSYFESKLAVPKEKAVAKTGVASLEYTNAEIAKLALAQNEQFLKVKFPNILSISDAVHDLNQIETHVIALYLKDNNTVGIPDKLEVKMPDGSVKTIATEIVKNVGVGKIHYSQLHTEISNSERPDYVGSICCAVKSSSSGNLIGVLSSAHIYTYGNYDDNYNGLLNSYQQKPIKLNGIEVGKWYLKIMNHNQDLGVIGLNENQQMDADYKKFNNTYHVVTDKDIRSAKPNATIILKNGTQKDAYIIDYNIGLDIYYDNGPSYKKDIILLGSSPVREKSITLTEGGNSGSCVYHKESNAIIGMLLGGNDKFSFVLPIQQTLNSFNLEVI